jgi:hypothetical protein
MSAQGTKIIHSEKRKLSRGMIQMKHGLRDGRADKRNMNKREREKRNRE